MASAPEWAPWPFLAALMSSSRQNTGDDGPEPPRVRGLGLVYGDFIVTLAHIAETADLAELASERPPRPVRPLTVEGGLALMAMSKRPETPVPVELGSAQGPVAVAIAADIALSVRAVPGKVEPADTPEGFRVALDGRLGEDSTASGSPVVAGETVVGIVAPTATSNSVDAFGTVAIERLLDAHGLRRVPSSPLSEMTLHALGGALDLADAVGTAAAVLLGVLRTGGEDSRKSVPARLFGRLDLDRLRLVYERFAGPAAAEPRRVDAREMTAEQLQRTTVGPLLARADVIRARVGEDGPHRRHLFAAVLDEPPGAFPDGFFEELGLSQAQLRRALHEVIAETYESHDAWDRLLAGSTAETFDLAGGHSADLVDPTTGIPLEDDHLGLRVDVTMFAALIADTKTPMPLSVGLFGEWGSGKSYFMALLRGEIRKLSESPDPRYRSEIVQIGFNAWHYADSNLWASLGDEIFEQLAGPQGQSTEARREALRTALDERLQRRAEIQAASDRAHEETKRLTTELDKATAERRTSARALAKAVLEAPSLRQDVAPALDRLGVKEPAQQIQLLSEELAQVPEDATDVGRGVARLPRGAIAAAFVIATVAIVAGIAASRELAGVGLAAVTLLTAAGGIAARVRSGARLLHQVADGVRHGQQDAIADELAALRQAETSERMVQTQLDEVIQQVGELSRELAEITPGQRLYRFVADRAASDTYRGQLGLISTIRKDFEQLNTLMKEWRENGAGADDPKRAIDRIVLYIDDLDRCSPEQVVEVLQAVHLLLAIDLFVVVVGVDPRWLLHSLRQEYRSLLTTEATDADDDRRWESTPQDYLEKIFNIPFALPRMTATSFEELVDSFVETEMETESEAAGPSPAPASPTYLRGPSLVIPQEEAEPVELRIEDLQAVVEEGSEIADLHAGAPETKPRPLTRDEIEMLTALAPLVQTPRETKRLVNLYRMMRSTRDLSPAALFLGDDDAPGEYQAVVILLGLLSGHARLLHDVLVAPAGANSRGGLRGRDPAETWADFAAGLVPRATDDGYRNDVIGVVPASDVGDWIRLAAGLEEVSARVTIPDLRPFQAWAPRIARFSFLLSPYSDAMPGTSDARRKRQRRGSSQEPSS